MLASSTGSLTSPTKLSKTYKSLTNESVSINTILINMSCFEDSLLISKTQDTILEAKNILIHHLNTILRMLD